jgi:hypothetical protein
MKPLLIAILVAAIAHLAGADQAAAQQGEKAITIEWLLKSGWQVAGFSDTADNRSAFILFKHPTETHLVQCRTGFDVTRPTPIYANCYELR